MLRGITEELNRSLIFGKTWSSSEMTHEEEEEEEVERKRRSSLMKREMGLMY